MSNKFHEIIGRHAEQLGVNLKVDNERMISAMFDMGEGRTQRVLVLHHPSEDGTKDIVEIASAVLDLSGMPDQQIGAAMALKLLRENDSTLCASWAIDKVGGCHLVAMGNWWLDEMDADEFGTTLYGVAAMADNLERQLGVDNF